MKIIVKKDNSIYSYKDLKSDKLLVDCEKQPIIEIAIEENEIKNLEKEWMENLKKEMKDFKEENQEERKAYILRTIPELKNEIQKLEEHYLDNVKKHGKEIADLFLDFYEIPQKYKMVKKLEFEFLIKFKTDAEKITDEEIQRAKEFLIENLIETNSAGFTKCIFHEEKTPSFKVYKDTNKAYCFGCFKTADAIDVFMKLNNCDFKTAVKNLSK